MMVEEQYFLFGMLVGVLLTLTVIVLVWSWHTNRKMDNLLAEMCDNDSSIHIPTGPMQGTWRPEDNP